MTSELRNRRTGNSAADRKQMADEALEPLLQSNRQQLIHAPGPFDLQQFLQSIFLAWQRFLDAICAYLYGGGTGYKLSMLQAEKLEILQTRVGVPFRPEDESHQEALRQLWGHAFPQLSCTSLKTAQWKEMGWQGEDPATDFRGSGHLGLECLIYLAEVHPDTFARLMGKLEGQRSEWEYPFAVAGLNLTFMLEEVVGLRRSRTGPPQQPAASTSGLLPPATQTPAGRGFLKLLTSDISNVAFEELFVASYELLDQEWLRRKASYMEFGEVIKSVKGTVTAELARGPVDVPALRGMMGLSNE